MKLRLLVFSLLLAILVIAPKQGSAQGDDVSFQVFYDDLSPYGHWVNHPQYGYVWSPSVGPDFEPYASAGHWVLTDYGWTWVSDYQWGWAPFHYGRWDFDAAYGGWYWCPDETWGPAWVSWRRSPGYYGWCPLAPGISVSYAMGGRWHAPDNRWTFCNERYIGRSDVGHYYAPRGQVGGIVHNSTPINNTYEDKGRHNTYISGPKREEVQRVSGAPVHNVAIHESNKPQQSAVRGNELVMYRPKVAKATSAQPRPAPARVARPEEVRVNNGMNKPQQTPAHATSRQQATPQQQHSQVRPAQQQNTQIHNRPQQSIPQQNFNNNQPRTQMNNRPTQQQQPRMQQTPSQQQAPQPQEPPRMQAPPQRMEQPEPQRMQQEPPHQEAPPREAPRQEAPPQEAPRQEAPRMEQPRMEQPHGEPGRR